MGTKDFFCYRNIFAIYPGYSFRNGAGYAIFCAETFKLIACGLVRPFAPGMDDHRAIVEIADKLHKCWEINVGFSVDPVYLVIEDQRIYPGTKINPSSLIKLARLTGMLTRDYNTPDKNVLIPSANVWKGNAPKTDTEHIIMEKLDVWSQKRLQNELISVPKFLQHNVFDAVGLALWAIEKIKIKKN